MLELRVRISWGDCVLCERRLAPPRDFWIGEEEADFALPQAVIGARRLRIVRVDQEGIWVDDALLPPGERASCTFGNFHFEITSEPRQRARFGYARDRRLAPFFAGAVLLVAGVLGYAAFVAPPVDDVELEREQVLLMQRYLMSAAEREVEAEEPRPHAASGATGSADGVSFRFAVQQPAADALITRQEALREATTFGLVGLLNASAQSVPGPQGGGHPIDEPPQPGDPLGDALDPRGGEEYADHGVNPPVEAAKDPLSTFAIDVDTGSYNVAKRKLGEGSLPPLASVRAEEFVNAFEYDYPGPHAEPFSVQMDAAPSPFEAGHHLLRIGIQGRRIPQSERPRVHLVYLVDTSGSMASPDKLGLAQTSLRLLTTKLGPDDTVALCTYAGSVREVLPPTRAANRAAILRAIDELDAEGSTAMASGIELAYRLAARTHVRGEISRVIVLSDGDANVGSKSPEQILESIRHHRQQGITLSTVGFGSGNYKDAVMEQLANAGDGNYSYVGNERDAKRTFVDQVDGLLQVIARDVKLQVEFDPRVVRRYRLIGYENRDVADRDFRNDQVDGGEIGAGHAVTALYDLELWRTDASPLTLRIRHKPALEGDRASELSFSMAAEDVLRSFAEVDSSFRFAAAVAGFAEVLRGSPHALDWSLDDIQELAATSQGQRAERAELVSLIGRANELRQTLALAGR
jgi:Ca-activated chloride channel homolog